jgi:small-conductance mechanosensitive channel
MNKHLSSIIVFVFVSINISAQELPPADTLDSVSRRENELREILLQTERQRIVDSVRKADLQQQIYLMQEVDDAKRSEAETKLRLLEQEDSINQAKQLERITLLREEAKGYPVAPFGDTLFFIYTKLGSTRPQERAEIISGKIQALYDDDFFRIDSLKLKQEEGSLDIIYKDLIVLSINDFDALWYNKSKEDIAEEYLAKIKLSIVEQRKEKHFAKLLLRIGLSILIIIGIWFLIHLTGKLFQKLNRWLVNKKAFFFKGIRFRNYDFLTPKQELRWAMKINGIIKWLVILLLVYLTLPLIFSLFPFSRGWANVLLTWVWVPFRGILLAIWDYLPNVITILVIFFVTRYFIKLLGFIALEIENGNLQIPNFYPDWVKPTFLIVKILLYAFMFVVIFPYLPGADSAIFKGVSVFLGVLFSLGSSNAIANMVAGFVITYMRAFKIGDRIKVGEVVGDVVEKTMLVIRIRTNKNEEITVPNSTVLSQHTINYTSSTREQGLIVHTTVTIGYDVPWRTMHETLIEAALRTELIERDPKPFVLQLSLNDFFVTYQLNAYTKEANHHTTVYSMLHQSIQDACNEKGIEIMSPHYRNVRDGNKTTIPEDYLPKEYQAPAFKVDNQNNSRE